jgi:hypothetical protein
MRFWMHGWVWASLLVACGGAPRATPTTPPAEVAEQAEVARLLPPARDTFVCVSIDAILRTPLGERVTPAIARMAAFSGLSVDPRILETFVGAEQGGVRRTAVVFAETGPSPREWLDTAAEQHERTLSWIDQPVPHVRVDSRGTALSVVAPRVLYIGPLDEVPSLRPRSTVAGDPDLARPPGELLRAETSVPPREVGAIMRGASGLALSAYDTGNAVRLVLEMRFPSLRDAESQALAMERVIAEARADASNPLSAVLATATFTRDGLRSIVVMSFSYEVAGMLLDTLSRDD